MSDEQKYTIQGLDEYIRQGEPQQRERGEAWKVAIGLQQVDRLQTSEYLLDTAKRHIEGDISIGEAKELIDSYYKSASGRKEVENDLKNRIMHVDWGKVADEATPQSANIGIQSAKLGDELPPKCKNCTLEEVAVLRMMHENPSATQKEIATAIGERAASEG